MMNYVKTNLGGLLFQFIRNSYANERLYAFGCKTYTALKPDAPSANFRLGDHLTTIYLDAVKARLVAANPRIVILRCVVLAFNGQPNLNGIKHHLADLVDDCCVFNSLHVYHLVASDNRTLGYWLDDTNSINDGVTQWRFGRCLVGTASDEQAEP